MHRGQVIDEVIDDSDEDGLDQLSVLLPARSSQGGSRRLGVLHFIHCICI